MAEGLPSAPLTEEALPPAGLFLYAPRETTREGARA